MTPYVVFLTGLIILWTYFEDGISKQFTLAPSSYSNFLLTISQGIAFTHILRRVPWTSEKVNKCFLYFISLVLFLEDASWYFRRLGAYMLGAPNMLRRKLHRWQTDREKYPPGPRAAQKRPSQCIRPFQHLEQKYYEYLSIYYKPCGMSLIWCTISSKRTFCPPPPTKP